MRSDRKTGKSLNLASPSVSSQRPLILAKRQISPSSVAVCSSRRALVLSSRAAILMCLTSAAEENQAPCTISDGVFHMIIKS